MRRIVIGSIVGGVVLAGASLLLTAQSVEGLFGAPFGPYAYNSDVNKDSHVNSTDLLIAAKNQGLLVPAALLPPTIVGNRAFATNYGLGITVQLVNTDDGSVVATLPIGDSPFPVSPFSCDGAYALITSPSGSGVTVRIISTRDGSTVANDPTVSYDPAVQFTCPLQGLNARFSTGRPVADRAVVRTADINQGRHVRLFDLTTGQVSYSNDSTNGQFVLSCAQNTIAVVDVTGGTASTIIVRLSDGGIVANDSYWTIVDDLLCRCLARWRRAV